jgi:hypothetical protein
LGSKNSPSVVLPKKSLELSSGPHFTSRGVWGGGVGLVRVRACVEAMIGVVEAGAKEKWGEREPKGQGPASYPTL